MRSGKASGLSKAVGPVATGTPEVTGPTGVYPDCQKYPKQIAQTVQTAQKSITMLQIFWGHCGDPQISYPHSEPRLWPKGEGQGHLVNYCVQVFLSRYGPCLRLGKSGYKKRAFRDHQYLLVQQLQAFPESAP